MQWSDIQFRPPAKTLRQFAGLWLVCFSGLAAWEGFVRGHANLAVALATLALTIGPLGLAWPRFIRPVFVAWMVLAFPIGWTVSQLILAHDILWLVHSDQLDIPAYRPRPAPSRPPAGDWNHTGLPRQHQPTPGVTSNSSESGKRRVAREERKDA